MNAANQRMYLDAQAVARGATEKMPRGHGPLWSHYSYREDVNEAPAMVEHEPVDVEAAKPLIVNTPIEGWNSDAIDPEAEICFMPDE